MNYFFVIYELFGEYFVSEVNWRPPSLSQLTPMIFDMGLTHLGSEAFNYA